MAITCALLATATADLAGSPGPPFTPATTVLAVGAGIGSGDTVLVFGNTAGPGTTVVDSAGNEYKRGSGFWYSKNCAATGGGGTVTITWDWTGYESAQYGGVFSDPAHAIIAAAVGVTGAGANPSISVSGSGGEISTPASGVFVATIPFPVAEARECVYIANFIGSNVFGYGSTAALSGGTVSPATFTSLTTLTNSDTGTLPIWQVWMATYQQILYRVEAAGATPADLSLTIDTGVPFFNGRLAGFGFFIQATSPPKTHLATVRLAEGRRLTGYGDSPGIRVERYNAAGLYTEATQNTAQIAALELQGIQLLRSKANIAYLIYTTTGNITTLLESRDSGVTWDSVASIASTYQGNDGWLDDRTGVMVVPVFSSGGSRWDYYVGQLNAGGTAWSFAGPFTLVSSAKAHGRVLVDQAGQWWFVYLSSGDEVKIVRCKNLLAASAGTWSAVATVGSSFNGCDAWIDHRSGLFVVPCFLSASSRWDYYAGQLNAAGTAWTFSGPRTLIGSAKNAGRLRSEPDGGWSFNYVDDSNVIRIAWSRSLTGSAGTFS